MNNVSFYTMKELISCGFRFPQYEHFLNKGMVYYYEGDEFVIGGYSESEFTDEEKLIAQKGLWLPNSCQLLEWLQATDFRYTIEWNPKNNYYCVSAHDCRCNGTYTAGGIDFVNAVAKVICKICKSRKREYAPRERLIIPVESIE